MIVLYDARLARGFRFRGSYPSASRHLPLIRVSSVRGRGRFRCRMFSPIVTSTGTSTCSLPVLVLQTPLHNVQLCLRRRTVPRTIPFCVATLTRRQKENAGDHIRRKVRLDAAHLQPQKSLKPEFCRITTTLNKKEVKTHRETALLCSRNG